MNDDTASAPPTEADLTRWLTLLAAESGHAIEIRAPKCRRDGRTLNIVTRLAPSDFAAAAREALALSGKAPAVYVLLNGVRRDLPLGRSLRDGGAKGVDVPRRLWLLIDTDPVRPADSNATDEEKAASYALALAVRSWLLARGFPEPVIADSGNGTHLLYRVDLANGAASTALIKGVLNALADRFDAPAVTIDRKVFDAPRLVKAYGTLAAKGENSPERPHRYSRILDVPTDLRPVSVDLLRALASEAVVPAAATPASAPSATRGTPSPQRSGAALDVEERAAKYLEKCPNAVAGQGGHDVTFKTACKIGPGFDLPEETAFRLLWTHFNPRCEPPWSERELRHKVAEAYRIETRRGFLRDAATTNSAAKDDGRGGALRPGAPPRDDERREVSGRDDTPNGRPLILITSEEHQVVDEAVAAIAADPTIFRRGFMLVTVQRDHAPAQGIIRPPGTPRICPLPLPRLRERLTKFAEWGKSRLDKDGNPQITPAHPPEWAVNGVAARGEWPALPSLEAVVESPVLRPDGSILDVAGYDPQTGLLYEPNAAFPPVPARPTLHDARAAAELLLDLVADFPFASDPHKAAWLAGLLTTLGRFAIDGPCPLFLFEAPAAGSGKSLLADVIAGIRDGREMTRKDYPERSEGLPKVVTAIAMAGDPIVLFDNIASTFGGSALDSVLTARTWKDRILGQSQMTADLPLLTVWFGTANNVSLRGDIVRRIVPCRLEPNVERPEERTQFRYPKLFQHVRVNRPRLVVAALSLLRAYVVAGRPVQQVPQFGSYEAWSDLIRSAIVWATGIDPCASRDDLRAADDAAESGAAVVLGWTELPYGTSKGHTASEALKLLREHPEKLDTLRQAVMSWSKNDELPSQKSVGNRLKALRGRVFGGNHLVSTPYQGTQVWVVRPTDPRGSGWSGGTCSRAFAGEKSEEIKGEKGREQHPPEPSAPPNAPSCGSCFRLDRPECNHS
jgi:hypothetical protein